MLTKVFWSLTGGVIGVAVVALCITIREAWCTRDLGWFFFVAFLLIYGGVILRLFTKGT